MISHKLVCGLSHKVVIWWFSSTLLSTSGPTSWYVDDDALASEWMKSSKLVRKSCSITEVTSCWAALVHTPWANFGPFRVFQWPRHNYSLICCFPFFYFFYTNWCYVATLYCFLFNALPHWLVLLGFFRQCGFLDYRQRISLIVATPRFHCNPITTEIILLLSNGLKREFEATFKLFLSSSTTTPKGIWGLRSKHEITCRHTME